MGQKVSCHLPWSQSKKPSFCRLLRAGIGAEAAIGDVVRNGVAGHVAEGVGFGCIVALAADDDG